MFTTIFLLESAPIGVVTVVVFIDVEGEPFLTVEVGGAAAAAAEAPLVTALMTVAVAAGGETLAKLMLVPILDNLDWTASRLSLEAAAAAAAVVDDEVLEEPVDTFVSSLKTDALKTRIENTYRVKTQRV